ncbi:integrase/recombinase XerD [Fictibacillus halophilus]|uniref:Integrase/recombinase XerD n=1 Tax=Fictibacillus halophilus TaxID=1610490 RepID=A0ABV2LEF8_9BACL|nr:site-specific tyrosine recombinase/integron integrase [Fictibacillus halophilus]
MDNSLDLEGFKNINKETRGILNDYLLSLNTANKSEATITKYQWILEKFLSQCAIPIEKISSKDVLDWLNDYSEGKSPKTMDLVLACLSSFFTFCLEEEYMEKQVLKKRWRPKIPQTLPRHLTEKEYARVRLAAESLSLRDRALILFLFSSGCRRQEVSDLNIEDINLVQRKAKVRGKGKRIRTVHFSEECALILKEYLNERSQDEKAPLFLNRKGSRLMPTGIYEVTKKLGKKAGLNHLLHPHICRHTFATNMLARGADIQFIADEMGHVNLNTTRIYARIPTEDMMLAYQNKMG